MVLRRVLVIGDHRHREFENTIQWLATHSLLSSAATPREALDGMVHPALPPEVIVVALSRPSQFSSQQIEAVFRLAPLSRLVVLAGSWCEGELRTGHPWPGVIRLYWHQGEARFQEMLSEPNPLWSHPRTATDVERLLATPVSGHDGRKQMIAIGTESSITYHGLATTCAAAGYATVWIPPRQPTMVHNIAAGIWDELQRPPSPGCLRTFVRQARGAPIVALLNFPRLEDYQRLQDEGVKKVIAKPFMNADLLGAISHQMDVAANEDRVPHQSVA